jgi:mRNA interferase MazF
VVMKRFDIHLVALDPTLGSEIQKIRPCVIVSPDTMNQRLATVIVAPMTTHCRNFPTRVACNFQGKQGQVALDQIRTVDKVRLVKRLGHISPSVQAAILEELTQMFAK